MDMSRGYEFLTDRNLISLAGFHEVAYTGNCESKLHGHEPRV